MTRQRIDLPPLEAAALSRLLDAYLATDEADPGADDLRRTAARVDRLEQDHAAYGRPQPTDPEAGR